MIDTVKIYCEIDKGTYDRIFNLSIVKSAIDRKSGELLYTISNAHLEGSYSSSLSVRVGTSSKYRLCSTGCCIEIEGSYHKIFRGYNSHNGFYDLQFICIELIEIVCNYYNTDLPPIENWYLQRCDIALCFNLNSQDDVCKYINNLSSCNYSRRKVKFFSNETFYVSGTTTTLKIYNKLLEFKKHDMKKFINTDFDLISYISSIKGFIRFECEIKKKLLKELYNNIHIKVIDVNYDELRKVWSDEFMKLYKITNNTLEIIEEREEVLERLKKFYKPVQAVNIYNFFVMCKTDGVENVKKRLSQATYYRNIKYLKDLNIDVSQKYDIIEQEASIIQFNPFTAVEVY